MANLFDGVDSISGGATEGVQKILRAKTGKEITPTGPRQSSMGEAMALQSVKKQERSLAQQVGIQQQKAKVTQKQIDEQKRADRLQIETSVLDMDERRITATADILAKAERGEDELEFRQDALELEQAAHNLSMQDQEYVSNLKQIGRERRLFDDAAFDVEMDKMVYGNELTMLLEETKWKEKEGNLSRDRKSEIFKIDIDMAMQIAAADLKEKNYRSIISGVQTAATAGAEIVSKMPKTKPTEPKTGIVEPSTQTTPSFAGTIA